ncbi:MAG: universal stress protein [Chitinophagaceae bacterium]
MNYQIKNILVPVDFSDAANNALQVAVAMASRHKAVIHLLHVMLPQVYIDPTGMYAPMQEFEQNFMDDAREKLSKHKAAIRKTNEVEVTTEIGVGSVAICVSNYVLNNQKDLVVMGTHGISGWNEFFLGSNAMATIKECSCPVLTIPPSFKKRTFDSILYPIRNVEGVVEKYDYIKPIVEKNDAQIHLLGVAQEDDEYESTLLSNKLKAVREAIAHDNQYISYETYQCTNIASKILEVAHTRNDDIIIINATLDKAWYNFFGGSYTQQIVNHSKIPVLAVKPALTPDLIQQREVFFATEAQHYRPLEIPPL